MDKIKIKKEYQKKIKNLIKLNRHYYELSKPIVEDQEYDQIKSEIFSLEKKYDFFEIGEVWNSQLNSCAISLWHKGTISKKSFLWNLHRWAL